MQRLDSRSTRRQWTIASLCAAVVLAATPSARADIPLRAKRIASGLSNALYVTSPPGDDQRLFIVQKGSGGTANIRLFDQTTGTLAATPFLTVTGLNTAPNEQGLLGLAFHPNYAANGQFYLNYVVPGGSAGQGITRIVRYTRSAANPNLADGSSAYTLLSYDQPYNNHNGGWMAFGPGDGYLYISAGDGGSGNDPGNRAQNTASLFGKILRIDVNADEFPTDAARNYAIPHGSAAPGAPPKNPFAAPYDNPANNPAGADEVWHYGLRNPWRNSFDRKTGDLYIGDVGQNAWEEIDFQPAGSGGGMNFGWRPKEGAHDNAAVADAWPANAVDPIHEYDHSPYAPKGNTTQRSITGGYVYRGNENPALEGTYFFGDYQTGQIWSFKYEGTSKTKSRELTGQIPADVGTINAPASFGEDNQGRLYIVDYDGEVFRLVPPIPGDADGNRLVNNADLRILVQNFRPGTAGRTWAQGDFNDDGIVDFADYQILEPYFGRSIPISAIPADLPAAVPEPGGTLLLLVAPALLCKRRSHRPSRVNAFRKQ